MYCTKAQLWCRQWLTGSLEGVLQACGEGFGAGRLKFSSRRVFVVNLLLATSAEPLSLAATAQADMCNRYDVPKQHP